jgi:Glycine rich protein
MKQLLLAGTAVLGLVASGLAVRATPIDFTYTGSLVDFTVPATGTYQIIAFGAQGGSGGFPVCVAISCSGLGGRGAEIGGNFILTAGEILQLAVGGAGADSPSGGGGGGGGSFVVGSDNTPLVIAGGGGGVPALWWGPSLAKVVSPVRMVVTVLRLVTTAARMVMVGVVADFAVVAVVAFSVLAAMVLLHW